MPAFGIAAYLKLAYSTVCRYLQKHGISRKRDLEPTPKPRRYERNAPGEIIHIDIKKLAKIDGVGHRIHGDRTKGNGKGWEYLHVAIDDHSRLAYSESSISASVPFSVFGQPQGKTPEWKHYKIALTFPDSYIYYTYILNARQGYDGYSHS